jgi:hypothetical protein
VVRACNPCTWEAETGGMQVQGYLGYWVRLCFKKEKINKNKKLKKKKDNLIGYSLVNHKWIG